MTENDRQAYNIEWAVRQRKAGRFTSEELVKYMNTQAYVED